MNFKEKVLNFYENPEKFKEHRWIMLLVICGLTVSKDFIKKTKFQFFVILFF